MIQLQFLNKILDTKDPSVLLLNSIDGSFFYDEYTYPKEFAFIDEHIKKYGCVPDKETFLSKFPKFPLVKVDENMDYLLDALYEDRNKAILAKTFNKIRDLTMSGNVDDAMKLYLNSMNDISKATHIEAVDIFQDKSRYDAYLARGEDYKKYYVKTGFDELDKVIGGWDREEELATIIARTGVGKSWCLLKCAVQAAQEGLKVGYYSGEITEKKLGYRIDTLISHISNRGMLTGRSDIQNDYKKFIDTVNDAVSGTIIVLTPKMLGHFAGVTDLRAFIEKYNLDMLCIDQHSLLNDDKKGRTSVEKASNISTDLVLLQKLKRIPFIAACQQNRESTEGGITTKNVSLADKIAQDSTVVLAFEAKDENILNAYITKGRDGGTGGKFSYMVDFDKGVFSYMPTEKDASGGKACDDLRKTYESSDGGDVF